MLALLLPLVLAQGPAPTAITQTAYLKPQSPGKEDLFGFSVAVSGSRAVVGMPFDKSAAGGVGANPFDNSMGGAGSATIFEWNGSSWSDVAYLKAPSPSLWNYVGHSVGIDGDLVVLGAPSQSGTGAAFVYRFDGTAWKYEAKLVPSSPTAKDRFGFSVDVSGQTIVIGADGEDGSGTGVNPAVDNSLYAAGAAYVFDFDGTSWSQTAYIKAPNADANDGFGRVALSGDLLVVGAEYEDSASGGVDGNQSDNSLSNSGAVYVYRRTAGVWGHEAYLKAANTIIGHGFGASLDVDDGTIVVGAAFDNSFATGVDGDPLAIGAANAGAAFVFDRQPTGWSQSAYLKASNTQSTDYFGGCVAVAGDFIAVGAAKEDSGSAGIDGLQSDESTLSSGAVYLYRRVGAAWEVSNYIKASTPGQADRFGGDPRESGGLDLDGNLLVVGALGEASSSAGIDGDETDDSKVSAGAAYAFDLGLPCTTTSYGPGAPGNPASLSSATAPEAGSTFVLDVQHGSADTTALLVLAGNKASVPAFGGSLLVDWPSLLLPPPGFATVPLIGGSGSKNLALPHGTTGISFFAQVAVLDAAQPGGLALSNGLAITICP